MRARIVGLWLVAVAVAACATALPPTVKVTDINTLAGTYSGKMKETGAFDRSAELVVQPGGKFELTASEPNGFRTVGLLTLAPDGTLTYRHDELRGHGVVFTGKGVVREGDGRRVIVLTTDDGSTTITVSKSLS